MLQARIGKDKGEMELPLDMRPAVELAVYSHDQVRPVAGLGGLAFLSFDQTAVEAVARMHGISFTPRVAKDLMILQAEGLKLMQVAQ